MWQCPSCCEKNDDVKPLCNVETSSKRARSKSIEKHRSEHKLPDHDKPQVSGRISTAEKNKSSNKAKTTISFKALSGEQKPVCSQAGCSQIPTASPSSDGGSRGGVSAAAESGGKLDQGSSSISKTSSHKEVHFPLDPVSMDANEKTLKEKTQNRGERQRKKDILSLVQSTQVSKKERCKANRVDKKKRSRSHKPKHAVADSNHTSKGISPLDEASESLLKQPSFNQQDSASVTKTGTRVLKLSIKNHPEVALTIFFILSRDS